MTQRNTIKPRSGQLAGRAAVLLASTMLAAPVFAQTVPTASPPTVEADQTVPGDPTSPRASDRPPPPGANDKDRDVVVTGTLIRGLDARLPIPVTTITAQDIVNRGYTSVADALARSSFADGGVNPPFSGFTQGARTISVFGFLPGLTKYLVDGHPALNYPGLYNNASSFVDLSAIPTALVSAVEILPGGQSSLYGSDAIAGVVNVRLKKKLTGPEIELRSGFYEHGGGRTLRFAAADGFQTGALSVLGGVQYENVAPLWTFQRDLTKGAFTGGNNPAQPQAVFQLLNQSNQVVSVPTGSCAGSAQYFNNNVNLYNVATTGATYCANTGYYTFTQINRESRVQSYVHATYDFSDKTTLYTDLLFNRAKSAYTYALTGPFAQSALFYSPQIGQNIRLYRYFSPEEFGGLDNRLSNDRQTAVSATLGLRGSVGGTFDYDLTVIHNRQDLDMYRGALLTAPLTAYFNSILGTQQGVRNGVPIYNANFTSFFSGVPTSTFDGFRSSYEGHARTRSTYGRALLSNNHLLRLPGGEAGLALAVEGDTESWAFIPDPRRASGIYYSVGNDAAGSGTRRYVAGVGELQLPIVSFANVSGSARYDRYFTQGNQTGKFSYNAALEVHPTHFFSVRARYGTAFKAPDLVDLYLAPTVNSSFATDTARCIKLGYSISNTTGCPYNVVPVTFTSKGNPDLKPLTAQVMDLGGTVTPVPGVSFRVDYLRWHVNNAVTTFDVLNQDALCAQGGADPALCAIAAQYITRDAAGNLVSLINPKVNLSSLIVRTLVIDGSIAHDFGELGIFSLRGSLTRLLERRTQQNPAAVVVDELADPLRFRGGRTKANAYLTWSRKAVNLGIGFDRTGRSAVDIASRTSFAGRGGDQTLAPWWVWTLSGGVGITSHLRVSGTVNNLFDKSPPIDKTVLGQSYTPFNVTTSNAYGRQFLLQANYKF